MSKAKVFRGKVFIKEAALTESLTNRILSIDPVTGEITDRPAISLTGYISSVLPSGQIIVGNVSNVATPVAMTGDVTINNSGVTAIGAGVIVNADINAAAAIAYSKLNLVGSIVNADISAVAAIAYSKLNLANSIVNADIAAAAAIARSKMASGTAYRILANNAAGVMSENAAITASRAVVSDANGQLVHSATTATQIGYLSTATSDIQVQLNTLIAGRPTSSLVQSPSGTENGYAITWDDGAGQYTLTDPVAQGIPIGGTARQFLGKNTGTDYDASWLDLLVSDITDLTANADDLNVMAGADAAGITPTIISYLAGITSSVQTQLDGKLSSTLAHNAILVGDASNIATPLSGGTNGYVLTSVGGTPTWMSPSIIGRHIIQDEGTPQTARANLNFVGATVTVTDDAGNDATVVTISGSAGGGHVIENAGTPLTNRANLNFTDGLEAVDDSGNDASVVSIADNGVTYAKLQQASAGFTIIGKSTTGVGDYSEITAGVDDVLRRSGSGNLVFGSLVTNNIGNAQITYAKIQNVGALSVIGRSANSSGVSADISAGADHNILRRSGVSIGFGAIDLSQSGAVGSSVLSAANGGTGQSSYTVGDLLYASGATALSKLAGVATGNILISGGVATAPAWGKVTSSHIDSSVTDAFWKSASGTVLTGANTISGAFNIGFTNSAVGIGVAPGSIAASAKLNVVGYTVIDGTDNSSATFSMNVRNLAGDVIIRTRNDQAVEIGGTSFVIDIGSTITSGNARLVMNGNQAMGLIIEDRNSKEYVSFRTTTSDERFNIRVKQRLENLSVTTPSIFPNGAPTDRFQFGATALTSGSATVTLIGSISMPTDEQVIFFEAKFRAVDSGGLGGYQKIKGAIQRTSAGTVQDFGTQVADTINRTGAQTFLFSVDEDNTNKRINLNFTNNIASEIAYTVEVDVEWTTITEPA